MGTVLRWSPTAEELPGYTAPEVLGTDEGNRALFLMARLTTRWVCRYG
ncbi:hypothetical protein OHA27_12865 [Streptomyces sp. NBC_01619]|uniref:Uncharacterized protein n=1 Tax=Streptomyces pratisoli TaxID=3139917 RepID=A0ACC6Q9Z3_9ACTN|nr:MULTISPECIES: hypothetical protein [unclassified Streptomyces]MCX4511182.1 hypothetical protein [Streptomyces sp. NBC_01619]